MQDLVGRLWFAVIGTIFMGFGIWVIRSVAWDMHERKSPRWIRWLILLLSLVPPPPMWGLALWMYDVKRHPPGPDGGSGWIGASRRWGRRRTRPPLSERRRQWGLVIAAAVVVGAYSVVAIIT